MLHCMDPTSRLNYALAATHACLNKLVQFVFVLFLRHQRTQGHLLPYTLGQIAGACVVACTTTHARHGSSIAGSAMAMYDLGYESAAPVYAEPQSIAGGGEASSSCKASHPMLHHRQLLP